MGIAPILVERIYETIAEINNQGTTILLVEQNANYALSVSQRGYVLETGAVALTDDSDKLRENPEVQKAYLGRMTSMLAVIGVKRAVPALQLAGVGDRRLVPVGQEGLRRALGLASGLLLSAARRPDLARRPGQADVGLEGRRARPARKAARRRELSPRSVGRLASVSRSASSRSGCRKS